MLVRFVFRYLIKGIRTRALSKRYCASFLAVARRLLQSINIDNQSFHIKLIRHPLGKGTPTTIAVNLFLVFCHPVSQEVMKHH